MSYGDGDVQWMRAGRGVIHEEMWDLVDAEWAHKRIEIFQLWVNLPKKSKNLDPSLHLLKNEDIPNIDCGNGVSVKIISGSVFDCSTTATPSLSSVSSERAVSISQGLNPETERDEDTYSGIQGPGSDVSESPVSILHINLAKPNSVVNLSVESDCTVTVYVRRGSLLLGGQEQEKEQGEKEQGGGGGESQEVRPGDVVVFRISPEGKQYLSQGGSSSSTNVGGRDKSNSGLRQGPGLGVVTLSAGLNGLGECIGHLEL